MTSSSQRLPVAEAEELATRAFQRAGVSFEAARDAAEILTLAEMMGIATHGLKRVATYTARIEAGGIRAGATPRVTAPAPALRQVDGDDGLGPATARLALRKGIAAARDCGVGAVFLRRGAHLGALAPYLWIAAEAGMAAIVTTNTAPMLASAGGREALIGNNPVGLGLPGPKGAHVMLDMALSVAARSSVRAAAEMGAEIPDSWATDATGRPTTDARAAMEGLMQAIGGAKGAQLALCLDLMAATLSGAAMLSEIPNAAKAPDQPQGLGQMFLLIDAGKLLPGADPFARLEDAARMVGRSAAIDPANPPRLPGARAIAALRRTQKWGLDLPAPLLVDLKERAGV